MNIPQAAKRLQQLGDLVEKLIQQSNELRDRMIGVEETVEDTNESVEDTNERVEALERSVQRQEAILEALAAEQGIDVETLVDTVEPRVDDRDDASADDADEESADAGETDPDQPEPGAT